jgi:hypothetical protein
VGRALYQVPLSSDLLSPPEKVDLGGSGSSQVLHIPQTGDARHARALRGSGHVARIPATSNHSYEEGQAPKCLAGGRGNSTRPQVPTRRTLSVRTRTVLPPEARAAARARPLREERRPATGSERRGQAACEQQRMESADSDGDEPRNAAVHAFPQSSPLRTPCEGANSTKETRLRHRFDTIGFGTLRSEEGGCSSAGRPRERIGDHHPSAPALLLLRPRTTPPG